MAVERQGISAEAIEAISQMSPQELDAACAQFAAEAVRKHPLPLPTYGKTQPDLWDLLRARRKRDAMKCASRIILRSSSLANLFMLCDLSAFPPFHWLRKHFERVPEHLRSIPGLREDPFNAVRKVRAVFADRKLVNAHLLQDGEGWHLFFWNQRDLLSNHWKGGPHIHYASHLTHPMEVVGLIWQKFDDWTYNLSGSLHVRFRHVVHHAQPRR